MDVKKGTQPYGGINPAAITTKAILAERGFTVSVPKALPL
jgi:hypothetical protein